MVIIADIFVSVNFHQLVKFRQFFWRNLMLLERKYQISAHLIFPFFWKKCQKASTFINLFFDAFWCFFPKKGENQMSWNLVFSLKASKKFDESWWNLMKVDESWWLTKVDESWRLRKYQLVLQSLLQICLLLCFKYFTHF